MNAVANLAELEGRVAPATYPIEPTSWAYLYCLHHSLARWTEVALQVEVVSKEVD
jgi:hypothetical protein